MAIQWTPEELAEMAAWDAAVDADEISDDESLGAAQRPAEHRYGAREPKPQSIPKSERRRRRYAADPVYRARLQAKRRERYQRRRAAELERQRVYRDQHKTERAVYDRAYRETHREEIAARKRAHRARKKMEKEGIS